MTSVVYFGTKDKQSWIKAPSSPLNASSVGWAAKTQLLNGRASVRRSTGSHREFAAEWFGELNSGLDSSLQEIKNYADGLYGEGPFYWIDPFAAGQNILPPHWAAPMLTEGDWPNLASDLVPTFTKATVANGFPIKYASYPAGDAYESTVKLTIIIPSGYKLHFGWHGPAASPSTGVRITPYLRATGAAVTSLNPARLNAGGALRTNTQLNGATYSYVEIFLAADLEQSIDITGMIAQVLPDTASVASGGFIAGKGTTSLQFEGSPEIEYYSSSIGNGQAGMSVNLVEV